MMAKKRLVVCDDDAERVKAWADSISNVEGANEEFDVLALPVIEFANAFRGLKDRKMRARGVEETTPGTRGQSIEPALQLIDSADLLIIDYDLTPDPDRTALEPNEEQVVQGELRGESGETFEYLARCFSSAAYIVVVNQVFTSSTFDVTLQRFMSSVADLNVTAEDLDNAGLWHGTGDGFRPWGWPRLLAAPDHSRAVLDLFDLDQRVLETLGLADDDHVDALTARQLDPLGDEPQETSFRQLAEAAELGLRGKDQQSDESALKRIAAAAVRRW
jgi:hypothetical protein